MLRFSNTAGAADKCLSSRMLEIIKYKKDSFIVVKILNSKSYV